MSEKNEAGLNGLDMQAVVAAWIIANDGCGSRSEVDCGGNGGYFKGTRCPIYNCGACFLPYESKLARLREWLAIYHQEKAEAAEAEKRKAEAAKKEGPCGTCEECKHIGNTYATVIYCKEKDTRVPVGFTGCPDFEPRNTACHQPPSVSSEDVAEAVACAERYTEQNPSDTVPFRAAFFDVLKENRTLRNRLDKTAAEYSDLVTGALATKSKLNRHEERVFQLEKENAMLAHKIRGYKKGLRLAKEPCGKCSVKENNASLVDKCERLTEQRNKLSNDLIQATRIVKEVERMNDILAKNLVDCTAKWNGLGGVCVEKDGLIDRLRNANSRSISEMYRAEAELKDERRRKKEIEKENGALRSKLEQAVEDRKHLEEQLSESKQTLPPPMYLYATGVTAEEFLAMKGRCRQR